jgi:hypothetical protein
LLSTILDALAGGDSVEQIQEDYKVTQEDICAALEFARECETLSDDAVGRDVYKERNPFSQGKGGTE